MKKDSYVSLELAKLLKRAGYDWRCISYYQNGIFHPYSVDVDGKVMEFDVNSAPVYMDQYSAPTLYEAQRWMREVKDIAINVTDGIVYENDNVINPRKWFLNAHCFEIDKDVYDIGECDEYFDTYEQALEEGIKRVLKIII